jgi:hypothetical protein
MAAADSARAGAPRRALLLQSALASVAAGIPLYHVWRST